MGAVTADKMAAVAAGVRECLAENIHELGETDTRRLLGDVLPLGPQRLARTPREAAAAAEALGYPVVLKAYAQGVLHKSDHGLVLPGIHDAGGVQLAARHLIDRAAELDTGASWHLSVQRQLTGTEFAVGVRRNELGAFCMVAAGGVLVELLDDSAVGMAPLDLAGALTLVDRLRIAPLTRGYRGSAPLARHALAALLVSVSEVAVAVPELVELDLNPVFVDTDSALAVDARCVLAPAASSGERDPYGAVVRTILEPRSIAVIGASKNPSKPAGLLLKYLQRHGYRGELVTVNPHDPGLPGVRAYPNVDAVEEKVDLACIAVKAGDVPAAIEDCVRNDIDAGIVYAAGFSESGEEGERAQRELLDVAAGRFRFLGPNSIGVASPVNGTFATFGMALEGELPPPGYTALVSQSGSVASAVISRAREFGIGLSHWISTGNEADLDTADCIDYLADDPETKVICLFLEVVRNPAAFELACRRAQEAGKAVIAVKTGRSEAGRAAAASHTGSMAGDDRTYDALFERCRVLRVPDLVSLFTATLGVLLAGRGGGNRVGVVSMSGGACSLLADGCERAGLRVPELPATTQNALTDLLPSFGGVRNPVDVTAQGITSPDLVRATVELVQASGVVDVVLVQLGTNADPSAESIAADLSDLARLDGVPVLVGRLGAAALAPAALDLYQRAGMHVFVWPEHLIEAARASAWFGGHL